MFLTSEARSKMSKGMLALWSSMPRVRPPRPAPMIRTFGRGGEPTDG